MSDYITAIRERRQRVVRLTQQGVSAAEIGAIVGITERSVIRIRTELGIARQAAEPLSESELAAAAEFLADGCSRAEVARTLGRSAHAIKRHFPGSGWPPGEGARMAQFQRWANYRMKAVAV